jgi:hypothetical protein
MTINPETEDILREVTNILKNGGSRADISLYDFTITYIHVLIITLVTLHLVYFIYMLIRQNTLNPSQPKKKINETCIICLSDIHEEVQLICSHSYCARCIISYGKLRYDFHNLECPICRRISKLLFCQFERNDENQTTYDEIIKYNYHLTSKTTLCLSLDLFNLSFYYLRHITNFSNRRYDRHRKAVVVFILMVFLFIIYPLTYELELEIVEDVIFYLSLIVFLGEFFYRTIRENVNREYATFNAARFSEDVQPAAV